MPSRRYNPCSYLPRRLQIVTSLAVFILLTILFFGSSSDKATHYRESISQGAKKAADLFQENIHRQWSDNSMNPFRAPAHKAPAEQANSTSGDISWFSDWQWRNPFSISISYDDRALLPPEEPRTPIYTYYDHDAEKSKEETAAEHDLLLAWRRAWWAKGFRPTVLGRPEAVNNPLFKSMKGLKTSDSSLETDLLRWLAWGSMKSGILSNWLAFPMCDYDDASMQFLRRGKFPALTRFKNLDSAFYVGSRKDVNTAIEGLFESKQLPKGKSLEEVVPKATFQVESDPKSIAFYGVDNLKSKYKQVYDEIVANGAKGKVRLRKLIQSHLHSTWQTIFSDGIAVLRPIPNAMTAATTSALDLAGNLTTCLASPMASSCPPNLHKCKPCTSAQRMRIDTPKVYRNLSDVFTIGTVPHPYTMQALIKHDVIPSIKFLRRNTTRDSYILALTAEALGEGRASHERILYMKDAIAQEHGKAHSLWLTAERAFDRRWREDVSWILGFPIVTTEVQADGTNRINKAIPEGKEKKVVPSIEMPDEEGIKQEAFLVEQSKSWLRKKKGEQHKRMRDAVEAWNLADKELWSFVRAFAAQRRMEREKFEEEESDFAGADSASSGWGGRWFRKEDDL